jgi:signal transduction histidine kinase
MPPTTSLLSPSAACASALAVADELRAVLGPAEELARRLAAETPSFRPEFRRLVELSETLGIANTVLSELFPCGSEAYDAHSAYSVDAMARAILPMLRACAKGKARVTLTEDSHSPLLHGNPLALKRALLHIVRSLAATIGVTHGVIDVGVALIDFSDNDPAAEHSRSPTPRRMVRVTVADNGTGMNPDRIQAVMQSSADGGLPVRWQDAGLQIACGIVKAHGGLLDIETHPGLGTMVRIDLPVVWPGRPAPGAENAEADGRRFMSYLLP